MSGALAQLLGNVPGAGPSPSLLALLMGQRGGGPGSANMSPLAGLMQPQQKMGMNPPAPMLNLGGGGGQQQAAAGGGASMQQFLQLLQLLKQQQQQQGAQGGLGTTIDNLLGTNWFGDPTPGTSGGYNYGADLVSPTTGFVTVPPIPPAGDTP